MPASEDNLVCTIRGTSSFLMHLVLMETNFFTHVTIKSPRSGRILIVRNVQDALAVLTQSWLRRQSEKHAIACQVCRDALGDTRSPDEARAAFVEASREAGIYVTERTGSLLGTAPGILADTPEKPVGTA